MPECARCGDFTDNPAKNQYHYCDNCTDHFARIRNNGVIVQLIDDRGNYEVSVTAPGYEGKGGREPSQVEGLARGKKLADELGVPAMFEYQDTGSQWDLEKYLNEHPSVRSGVYNRLSRVPNRSVAGLLDRLKRVLFG